MRQPRERIRFQTLLGMLGLALFLAGCAAPEPRAALVAKSEAGSYGYSDTRLAESLYDVVYQSPSLSVPVGDDDREVRLAAERERAYDFALWHAAEKAQELGYEALVVEQDRRDADVDVQRERYYDPWPGYYGPRFGRYYGYPYPYRYGYWPGYRSWPGGYRDWASARVEVTLRVRFLKQMDEGALAVEETLAGLASRYGTPTYP